MTDERDEPPWDELDKGIRRIVTKLWNAGFTPISSCQGHGRSDAYVTLLLGDRDPAEAQVSVMAWLNREGFAHYATVAVVMDPAGEIIEPWLEVRWWGEVQFR